MHAATLAAVAVRDAGELPDATPYAQMQARLLAYDRE
jgi:hypothetical protein